MATKDISDAQVCAAVQAYQDAMRPLFPGPGEVVGILPVSEGACPPYPYEALAIETRQPEKVCYRAMERAERRGLIECGVSLRTGWLTAEGEALLAQYRSAPG